MSAPLSPHAAHMLRLADVVEKIERLAVLPSVVTDLLHSIDREDLDLGALAKKIAQDQALTAKTLRIANSSFYGGSGKITTVPQAIIRYLASITSPPAMRLASTGISRP